MAWLWHGHRYGMVSRLSLWHGLPTMPLVMAWSPDHAIRSTAGLPARLAIAASGDLRSGVWNGRETDPQRGLRYGMVSLVMAWSPDHAICSTAGLPKAARNGRFWRPTVGCVERSGDRSTTWTSLWHGLPTMPFVRPQVSRGRLATAASGDLRSSVWNGRETDPQRGLRYGMVSRPCHSFDRRSPVGGSQRPLLETYGRVCGGGTVGRPIHNAARYGMVSLVMAWSPSLWHGLPTMPFARPQVSRRRLATAASGDLRSGVWNGRETDPQPGSGDRSKT